jgi:hypothetical protein
MKKSLSLVILLISSIVFAQVPSYVPSNGLIGYWPFNANANDESGNGKNGTVTGATLTADRFGNPNTAYNFDGSNQFITCPSISELNGLTGATFSVWVKINGNNSWTNCNLGCAQYIISRDVDYSVSHIGLNFKLYNNKFGARTGAYNNANFAELETLNSYSIPQSDWHHIVFRIGSENLTIYLDGVYNSSTPFTGVISSSSGNLNFAKQPVPGYEYFLNGFLDDIGIWDRALTDQEILNLYNATSNNECLTMIINTGLLSTNPVTYNNTITIYPNPTNDHITIDCGNLANVVGYHIEISNALGQIIFNQPMNSPQYNVALNSWTGNGVYFVKIYDVQNNVLTIRKIILQ